MLGARHFCLLILLLIPALGNLAAQSSTDQTAKLFENSVRPVLVARCIKCHGPAKSESGLRLDTLQSILAGGDSGPALIPGDFKSSLLAAVLDHQHDIKMPPDQPLNEIEVQAIKDWIAQGAFWPEQLKLGNGPELRSGPPSDAELAFWAFQPLSESTPPPLSNTARINNDIDRFVQAKLQEHALRSNPSADKRTLIRRLTFDLTGLPPKPEEIDQFVNDSSSNAFDKLVDRLLDSPAYGERWGRHWLDVVRYSDTAGETADYPVPDAWRYRNYVIDAFNKDKPYDQFLREQIAGDILAYQNPSSENFSEQITATGFIAIARRFGFDSENYHHLTIQDTIDTVGQATLGLSIGCARCHDHKFDPFSTEDYYALYGIFESTLYPLAGSEQKQKVRSLVPLKPELSRPNAAAELTRSMAAKQETLVQLGRPVPPLVLRSLTDLDGDFELQSPASGGSRGVLVAPWLYDGPISVTNAAQSPFVNAFPKGKMGVSFPAGQALAGIWQALNHRAASLSGQALSLSVDFRVNPPTDLPANPEERSPATLGADKPKGDIATDLITSARSLTSTEHHGLRIDLCKDDMQSLTSLLVGTFTVQLQIGDRLYELGSIQPNRWYSVELSLSPSTMTLNGSIKEHDGSSTSFDLPISDLPNDKLTLLKVQTSQSQESSLPLFELDNLSITPYDSKAASSLASFNTKTGDTQVGEQQARERSFKLGDMKAVQDELKALTGIDGDLELQTEEQPPAKPWNPGPNSVVKIAARSQSPFRNYYDAGQLGVYLPNRAEYDGFGLQLENVKPNEAGHLLASFDFCCSSQEAGGSGSWRYYLGRGPGNSAAIELFFNGSNFFRRSSDAKDAIAEIKIGTWYQVQLDLDLNSKNYSGKLVSLDSEIAFTGQLASGWDGVIDYSFIDSYGHIGGPRPALDVDNFSLGQVSRPNIARPSSADSNSSAELQSSVSAESATHSDSTKRRSRVRDLQNKLVEIQAATEELERQLLAPPVDMSYAVVEGTPHDVPVQLRGEPSQPGKLVARRMPQLFNSSTQFAANSSGQLTGSGRLELAHWITEQSKPLAARVMVNRVWQQHFGRGLVRTENDFGTRGELPTHPELLDWLSRRFIDSGWSLKQLHRLIVRSAAYQQSSESNQLGVQADPENRWIWRFSPRRLSAEEIRDAMLLVSGRLDPSMGQEHPFPPPHTWGFTQHAPFYAVYETDRRSVYLMQQRIKRHPFLALFDGADPNVSTARRENTIVPTQALYLMNNPFVHQIAMKISEPCVSATSPSNAIDSLYLRCLGRGATQNETERALNFLDQYSAAQLQAEPTGDQQLRSAWAALARTLITRNEFLFVE